MTPHRRQPLRDDHPVRWRMLGAACAAAELLGMSLWFAASAVAPQLAAALVTVRRPGGVAHDDRATRLRVSVPRSRRCSIWPTCFRRAWFFAVAALAGAARTRRSLSADGFATALVLAISHRLLARRRLSAGDEDGVDLVSCATRSGDRHRRRRADGRQGDAVPRSRAAKRGTARRHPRGVGVRRDRRAARRRASTTTARIHFHRGHSRGGWCTRCSSDESGASRPAAISATCSSCIRSGRGFRRSSPRASPREGRPPEHTRASLVSLVGIRDDRDRRHRLRLGRARRGPTRTRTARDARDGAERQHARCSIRSRSDEASGCSAPLAWAWGFFVIADSAQFSALVTESVPPHAVGTALTVQTSLGFLLTMVSIQLIPPLVAVVGWKWVFPVLAHRSGVGIAAIRQLVRFDAVAPA